MVKKIVFVFLVQLFILSSFAQNAKPELKGWHLLDYKKDGYMGTGVKEAYQLLKNRKSTMVVIAVIDSGVDSAQADLKPNFWTNPKEIPNNGKDDDNNGYIDDVHGWNFDGSPSGENLSSNTYEITRVYHKWKGQFENKTGKDIPADSIFLFHQWQKSNELVNKQYSEYEDNIGNIESFVTATETASNLIDSQLNKKQFIKHDVDLIYAKDSIGWAVSVWEKVFSRSDDSTVTNVAIMDEIERYKNQLLNYKKIKEDMPVDYREKLTKDIYTDINDSIYGNNNLSGSSGNHGTHVCGIIGAIKDSAANVEGIVHNVRIMMIRAVPGGDEHDKDIALAIRYAVDNGASIINMSFGKPVSPYKKFVDNAVGYAQSRGVLLVHAAGNDGEDISDGFDYPNPKLLDGKTATNMLVVGASGDYSTGGLVASFSNYSPTLVDIFSPGVYINSTIPGNGNAAYDGTSMASPVAAGVAGLLKSYFPKLTPEQIIDVILRSGTEIKELVTQPGSDKKVSMKKLCRSGKIINAYEAVKLALKEYGD